MANQRARSVEIKIKLMYFYLKMNAELKELGFIFSKTLLYPVWLDFLANGLKFRVMLKVIAKKILSTKMRWL